ncbi:SpoIIE family protein phosphatase [Telmatobacter sp. DSM 110680]|uniref:SpoIIE family protein phosphatase n=1 Tax=Telmatobacter sp. DSM 110680 TaxID=3036704 RepID=A0AAU7DLV4_9BACT
MRLHKLLPAQWVAGSSRGIFCAFLTFAAFFVAACAPLRLSAESIAGKSESSAVLKIEALGKGAVPLDGAWQFHTGDNLAWAKPDVDDTAGQDGWEQLTADAPWGTQHHPNYDGSGWYRRRIELTTAPGAPADLALLVPAIDDVYELYWNGERVGGLGSFGPHIDYQNAIPAQTYGLGAIRSGVLAVRVLKVPFASNDDGTAGGFEGVPLLGSSDAIASLKDSLDYKWLRGQQFRFALTGLYALVSFLSLLAWQRDRQQLLLFWMMVYTFMPTLELILNGMRLQYSAIWITFFVQAAIQLREVAQWYVLIYLLQLEGAPRLMRAVKIFAIGSLIAGSLDGALGFFFGMLPKSSFQITDAVLTFFILPGESIPIFLVVYAVVRRRRLDSARWIVASIALANDVMYAVSNIAAQGVRFTHWQLAAWLNGLHLTVFGSVIALQAALRTALFLAIIYAVLRYAADYRHRQADMEREFQNAREVQQVLVPEALPAIPGFNLTSAYKPAREVGGDFFQILSTGEGGALIVIGDVSGKGMPAAMTVSLLVGTMRTLAHYTQNPGEILTAMNYRMLNRSAGGFTTCLVVRVDSDGTLTVANAGHLAPYVNGHELSLKNGLPLGLEAKTTYPESTFTLGVNEQLTLLTDGVVEARDRTGELYGFHRTAAIAKRSADSIAQAARDFGQEDDITVLTLCRVIPHMESALEVVSPQLSPSPA